jgi:hypothetical protein
MRMRSATEKLSEAEDGFANMEASPREIVYLIYFRMHKSVG